MTEQEQIDRIDSEDNIERRAQATVRKASPGSALNNIEYARFLSRGRLSDIKRARQRDHDRSNT